VGEARDYADQFDDVVGVIDGAAGGFARVGVDGIGEGKQLGQDLRRRYGSSVVELVTNARDVHARIPEVRLGMERGTFRFAADARMARAFTKISKEVGTAGHTRFDARRDADGHADEFSALLHAYHALIPTPDDTRPRDFRPIPMIR
jgi:phage FluMu gp28-like protein